MQEDIEVERERQRALTKPKGPKKLSRTIGRFIDSIGSDQDVRSGERPYRRIQRSARERENCSFDHHQRSFYFRGGYKLSSIAADRYRDAAVAALAPIMQCISLYVARGGEKSQDIFVCMCVCVSGMIWRKDMYMYIREECVYIYMGTRSSVKTAVNKCNKGAGEAKKWRKRAFSEIVGCILQGV